MILPNVDYSPLYNSIAAQGNARKASLMADSAGLTVRQVSLQRQGYGISEKAFNLQGRALDLQKQQNFTNNILNVANIAAGAIGQVYGIIQQRRMQDAKVEALKALPGLQQARMQSIRNGEYNIDYAPDGSVIDVNMGDRYNTYIEETINEITKKYGEFPEIQGWLTETLEKESATQKMTAYQEIYKQEWQQTVTRFEEAYGEAINGAIITHTPGAEITEQTINKSLQNVNAHIDSANFLSTEQRQKYKKDAEVAVLNGMQDKNVETYYRSNNNDIIKTLEHIDTMALDPEREQAVKGMIGNIHQEQTAKDKVVADKQYGIGLDAYRDWTLNYPMIDQLRADGLDAPRARELHQMVTSRYENAQKAAALSNSGASHDSSGYVADIHQMIEDGIHRDIIFDKIMYGERNNLFSSGESRSLQNKNDNRDENPVVASALKQFDSLQASGTYSYPEIGRYKNNFIDTIEKIRWNADGTQNTGPEIDQKIQEMADSMLLPLKVESIKEMFSNKPKDEWMNVEDDINNLTDTEAIIKTIATGNYIYWDKGQVQKAKDLREYVKEDMTWFYDKTRKDEGRAKQAEVYYHDDVRPIIIDEAGNHWEMDIVNNTRVFVPFDPNKDMTGKIRRNPRAGDMINTGGRWYTKEELSRNEWLGMRTVPGNQFNPESKEYLSVYNPDTKEWSTVY